MEKYIQEKRSLRGGSKFSTLNYEIVDIQNMEDNRFGVLTKSKFYYLD